MMSSSLTLTGYDLTDEGPGRTVNEDATLVREDLGLFALADGAGGRGKGDVAANLTLRSIENYIGSTVRRSHERPDYDVLGTPEQARRLSAAVHQAHQNILDVIVDDPSRKGMASTVVAMLMAPRTNQIHIAHVGDSRCYRMRHGRLERMTEDHTIAQEILERQPETPDTILEQLPRNSVVHALGMDEELRVSVRSLDLNAGDQFLLCTDGLTTFVSSESIWSTMREPDPASVIASELLNHALAARSQDNISILVVDCGEKIIDEQIDTRRYNEIPTHPPSAPQVEVGEAPNSAEFRGPEILAGGLVEAVEDWAMDSDFPTHALPVEERDVSRDFSAGLIEPPSDSETTSEPPPDSMQELSPDTVSSVRPDQEPTILQRTIERLTYSIDEDDLEFDEDLAEQESGVLELAQIDGKDGAD